MQPVAPMTVAFIALCITAIICDLRLRKVPNILVAAGLLLPLLVLVSTGEGLHGTTMATSLAGAVLGFVSLLPAYLMRKMGAGDVKFFSVLGFWLGSEPLVIVFVIGSLIAAAQALLTVALRQPPLRSDGDPHLQTAPTGTVIVSQGWGFAGRGIPYAAWLAIGALGWLVFHPV